MHVAPLQASTPCNRRFTLPTNSSSGFGSYPSDLRHFHTSPLVNCGLLVSLRVLFIRLPLPLRYTPWHVIQNVRYTPVGAYQSITIRFQALLTLCQEFFSAFPHGTNFAIGLDLYLGLEVDVPRLNAPFPRYTTQELVKVLNATLTGLSPSLASHSREFQITYEDQKDGPITPHSCYISATDSVCPVLRSLAVTNRIPIGFFSCGY